MDLSTQLTYEILLCRLLGRLLYQRPDREWMNNLFAEGVFADAPFADSQEDIARGLLLLQSWGRDVWAKSPPQAFSEIESDYVRLFVGLGKVLAPPWESVYFGEHLLFQEQTLHVRYWYQKFGLEAEHLHQEPDDHLGLELSFAAHLAQKAQLALEQQDLEFAQQLLKDQATFLSQHLLVWVPEWCDLVDRHAATDFYRGAAWMVRGALQAAVEIARSATPVSL